MESERYVNYDLQPGEDTLLHTYMPTSVHDWVLVDLWGKMQRDRSLEGSILTNAQTLHAFMSLLAHPGETRFALDAQGPYFCTWCEPVMSGISLGLWVREDKRKSRQCLIFGHQVFAELFKRYKVILVITRDETTKQFHEHFGFTFGCVIPYIYDGDSAYISFLTKETYEKKFQGRALPLAGEEEYSQWDVSRYLDIFAKQKGER